MTRHFTPTSDTQRDYRAALGSFASGVTVITAQTVDGPIGMTANSFSSVSLEPPLILWAVSNTSKRRDFFVSATHFAVHILRDDQTELSSRFARLGTDFSELDCATTPEGTPVFANCLTRFDCKTHSQIDGGDHTILLGHVLNVLSNEGRPLVHAQGSYCTTTVSI